MLKKWPLLIMMGVVMLVSAAWSGGVAHAGYYYEYTWDQYKGTEVKTFKLTPLPGREGSMDREKLITAISNMPNVYGGFNGYRTDSTTGTAIKSVTDGVYTYSITDSVYQTEPQIVNYANPSATDHTKWNGTDHIQIFMNGSVAASLAELFYEGTSTDGRYHFNANEVYLIHLWSSNVDSLSSLTAEALVQEGPVAFINREFVGQIKGRDPAAFPYNGVLDGYLYVYKGSEIKKD